MNRHGGKLSEQPPRDMPGFASAVAAGQTPARPAVPPTVTDPVAHKAFIRLAVTIGLATGAAIVVVFGFRSPEGTLGLWNGLAFAATLLIGYLAARRALYRFREALLRELQRGYTTTTFTQGLFWGRSAKALDAVNDDVIGWDWRGLWVLDSASFIQQSPDPAFDPPGLYPSPTVSDRRELWTGSRWSGVFPEAPFDT